MMQFIRQLVEIGAKFLIYYTEHVLSKFMNSFEDSWASAARLYEKWCKTVTVSKKVLNWVSSPAPNKAENLWESSKCVSTNSVAYRGEKYEERSNSRHLPCSLNPNASPTVLPMFWESDDPWPQSQHSVCKVAWQQLWKSFVAIVAFWGLSLSLSVHVSFHTRYTGIECAMGIRGHATCTYSCRVWLCWPKSSCIFLLCQSRVVAIICANDIELCPAAVWVLLLGVICHSHAIPCMALLILLGVLFPKWPSFAITTAQRLCTLLFPLLDPGTWYVFSATLFVSPILQNTPSPRTPHHQSPPNQNIIDTKKMTLTSYESDFGDFDFVLWTP